MQHETLSHVLSMCAHIKNKRIKRHDEIKNLVVDRLSNKYPVFAEPTVYVNGELRKPDLSLNTRKGC